MKQTNIPSQISEKLECSLSEKYSEHSDRTITDSQQLSGCNYNLEGSLGPGCCGKGCVGGNASLGPPGGHNSPGGATHFQPAQQLGEKQKSHKEECALPLGMLNANTKLLAGCH